MAKKHASFILKGAGYLASFNHQLFSALEKRGIPEETLYELLKGEDPKVIGALVDVFDAAANVNRNLVRVDTALGLSGLLAAVEAKDWSNSELLHPEWNPPKVLYRGTYEVEVEFLELGRDMTPSEIEAMVAAKDGYRLALPEETLAACAKDKDAQRKGPITCLGAFWVSPGGNRGTLVLGEFSGDRRAGLAWLEPQDRWLGSYRVAVVCKSTKHHETNAETSPLADMLAAGKYDWVNRNITQKNFPVDPARFTTEGCKVLHFNKVMTTVQVEVAICKEGYKPATIEQLLAYGAEHPEEQRKYPIVGLGSSWVDPRGNRDVPYLDEHARERDVFLHVADPSVQWEREYRFLAVRK